VVRLSQPQFVSLPSVPHGALNWNAAMFEDVRKAIGEICNNCNLILVDDETVVKALEIHERYRFSYYANGFNTPWLATLPYSQMGY
jgi:hypothetical protein